MATIEQALTLAVQHHQAGRLDEADALYAAILKTDPRQADALHLSGLVRHRRGDNVAAAALIEQALAVNPTLGHAWFNLGNTRRALDATAEAAAAYGEAGRLLPDFAPAFFSRGLALAALGRPAEAAATLTRAARLDPQNANTAYALAQTQAAAGNYEGMEAACRRAAAITPAAAPVWRLWAQTAMPRERLAAAETALRRCVRLEPNDAATQNDQARLMEALRVWDAAAEALAAVLRAGSTDDHVRLRLGVARRNAGAPAAAIEEALAPVILSPNDSLAAEGLYLCGLNARDDGAVNRAADFFDRALARRPQHSMARFHGGVTRMLLGQSPQAAFADGEAWAQAYAAQGDRLAAEERFKDACSHYLEASLHAPTCAAAHDGMATVLAERRRRCRYGEMADKAHTDEWGNIALFDAMSKYNGAIVVDPHLCGVSRPGAFRRPRIFDCFTFYNELDLLEMRLEELADLVDAFVIVEASWTFQGAAKPLILKENMARFARFADKIIHVVADRSDAGPSPWDREGYQRDSIMQGLAGVAAPDDVVFIGDVDEIPRRSVVAAMGDAPALAGRLNRLSADYYCGFLDFKCNYRWHKQISLPYKLLQALGPDHARFLAIAKYGNLLYNAGWHFSWLGGIEKVVGKLKAYAHSEYTGLADQDREALMSALRSGRGIFTLMDGSHGYGGEFSTVPLDDRFPDVVRRDPARYQQMGWLF